jgi:hypothetical protein
MITFDAHFDGQNLCPGKPISLPKNVRLRVTVMEGDDTSAPTSKTEPSQPVQSQGVFGPILDKLGLIEDPVDWSAEIDHYLYGTPKRGDESAS